MASGVLLILVILSPLLQWRQLSGQALRDLLKAEMLRVSDSVYVLQISPVRLRLLPGAIAFDSAYVTTDTVRRAAFPQRPVMRVSVHGCQLSGVNLWRLMLRQGLFGSLFQCRTARIGAEVATGDSVSNAQRDRRSGLGFLRLQREFKLPGMLPLISVRDINFPDIQLDLKRTRPAEPTDSVDLEKFSAHFEDFVLDPEQPVSERRPLFSRQVALAAEELAIGTGERVVSFRQMAVNLSAGSFTLLGFRMEPGDSAGAWLRRQPFRRPWIRLEADSIRFAGLDLGHLITEGKVITSRIIIGGLHATVEADASLPPRPPTVLPASPVYEAAVAAAAAVRLTAGTVQLLDGSVRYTQRRPGYPSKIVNLPRVSFEASDILVDPDLPADKQRPLLARVVQLNLDGATYGTDDSLRALTMGQLRLRVGDSMLVARQVTVGPALSDAAWMRRLTVRQTLGRATIDSVVMRGVNFDRLTVNSILEAREMAVSGVRVRLQKNMGLPAPPRPVGRTTPALDSALADLAVPVRIGRLSGEGDVSYIEHHPGLPDREFSVRKVTVTGERVAVGSGTTPDEIVPLLRQRLTLALIDVDRHWGKVRSVAVGRVTANLGDSTLTIDSIRIAPHFSPRPRRTGVWVALDSIRLAGVDFVQLADGHGARMRKAVFGNASVDIKVDAGIPSPVSRLPSPDSTFSGLSFPIAIGDLQVRRGQVRYTKLEPGKEPLVLSLGRIAVAGHSLALERGVTRPIVEQDIVARVSDVILSGASANAQAESATIDLGDSTVALRGIRLRTGSARDSAPGGKPPKSGVSVAVDSVRLGGIHLTELARGKTVRVGRVAVGTVDLEVRHAGSTKDSVPAAPGRNTSPKAGLPLAIGDLHIPVVHFRYVNVKPDGTERVYRVKTASVSAEGVALTPGAPRESRIQRISKQATITAEGIVIDDNPMNSFTIGSFAASLADSSARIGDILIGPTVSDSLWVSRQPHRRDRIRVNTDSVLLAGLDFDRLLLSDGIWLRHTRVYGFGIDVYTDKNLAPNPVKTRHSTVQHNVQHIKLPFGVDTVSVIDGAVVYNELETGKPEPGGVTFTDISATITGFTSRGVAGMSPPLRIETHSTIFGAGKLDAYATVPLTAAGLDASYYGRLGPMPARALNQFLEKSTPVTIERGEFHEVTFSVGAKDGHAVGTIVPVYSGLRVRLHEPGAGFFRRLKFSIITFAARTFVIRSDNPRREGEPPAVGTIDHTFDGESVIQFLWFAVRDGIQKSLMR